LNKINNTNRLTPPHLAEAFFDGAEIWKNIIPHQTVFLTLHPEVTEEPTVKQFLIKNRSVFLILKMLLWWHLSSRGNIQISTTINISQATNVSSMNGCTSVVSPLSQIPLNQDQI